MLQSAVQARPHLQLVLYALRLSCLQRDRAWVQGLLRLCRDLIADSVETVMGGQWYDANISLPGCDKNMPGTIIAMARLNRPAIMVYGGTIKPGYSRLTQQPIDIVSAFQSYGATHASLLATRACAIPKTMTAVGSVAPGNTQHGGDHNCKDLMQLRRSAQSGMLPPCRLAGSHAPASLRQSSKPLSRSQCNQLRCMKSRLSRGLGMQAAMQPTT